MKELFIRNSTFNGSLNGDRFAYQGKETPPPLSIVEETLQQSISPQKLPKEEAKGNVDKDVKNTQKTGDTEVMRFPAMDLRDRPEMESRLIRLPDEDVKITQNKGNEAVIRFPAVDLRDEAIILAEKEGVEQAFKKSPDQTTANVLTTEIIRKANQEYANAAPGTNGEKMFASLAKEYGITYDSVPLPSRFAREVLKDIIPASMLRDAIAQARTEKMPSRQSEETLLAKARDLSDLQKILDISQNPKGTLNAITAKLKGEVDDIIHNDTTGKPEEAFSKFASDYHIDKPAVWADSVILTRVLGGLQIDNPTLAQEAIANATRPMPKPGEPGVAFAKKAPEKAPETRIAAKKAPEKAPTLAQAAKVSPKAKEVAPNQQELAELSAKISKELPRELARQMMKQLDKMDAAHATPDEFSVITEKIDDILTNFQAEKNPKLARNEITRLKVDTDTLIAQRGIAGRTVASTKRE